MFNPIEYVSLSLTLPFGILPEMPAGIVAHTGAAVIAYKQHHPDWSLMGAKYWLLATVGTGLTVGGYIGAAQDDIVGAAMAVGLGGLAGVAMSVPALAIYLAVRRGWLSFIDRWVESGLTAVVTRFNAIRERRAERAAGRPSAPAKPRRMNGIPVTVRGANGEMETIVVNPNAMTLPAKIHLWAGIGRHVATGAAALYLLWLMPAWMRPIAETGAGIGMLGGFHLLHLVPHIFGF